MWSSDPPHTFCRILGLLACLALLACGASAVSTELRVAKLAADGSTVLAEKSVDYHWLEANLPVRGDGSTHYYHQGPTFDDADLWDPTESKNVEDKDMGAVKGTAVKDLCGLVGGMSPGDTLVVKASDGFSKRFSYGTVYSPPGRMGPMILAWYRGDEGYVPSFSTGMRLVFFADTSVNPWGWHVFGNADMKASMPSNEWHFFNGVYPTTTGLSVQSVNEIRILSTQSAVTTTATTRPPTPTATVPRSPTTQATAGAATTAIAPSGTTVPSGVPTMSPTLTSSLPPGAITTIPVDDGSGWVVTTGPTPNATGGIVPNVTGPGMTGAPNATDAGNITPPLSPTANATPNETVSLVEPAATGDGTIEYTISTDIEYTVVATATTIAATTVPETDTPVPSGTQIVSVTVAAPANTTPGPASAGIAAVTTTPGNNTYSRSISFTFSYQIRQNGDPALAADGSSDPLTAMLVRIFAAFFGVRLPS